jgi:hypothetical protein
MNTDFFLPNIKKFGAFADYMARSSSLYAGFSTSDESGTVHIYTKHALTAEETTAFAVIVNAYTDPAYWLSLARRESSALRSEMTAATSLEVVSTFIMAPNDIDDLSRLDSLKTIIEYNVSNVESYVDWDESSTNTATICVYDLTRNAMINHQILDTNPILLVFKNQAVSGATGSATQYKSHQVYGLHDYIPDYDCIWHFKVASSPVGLNIRLNGLERIYYYMNTT